jgi:formate dehydrogenase major subunit
MTNHWRDIQHADLVFINGGNPAEAHPVGFRWLMKAKRNGAKMIHTDPRFTRTSAVADIHVRTRTGTDVAYFGGLINYVLSNDLYHREYVEWATNAAFVVTSEYKFEDGMFNGFDEAAGKYDPTAWAYEKDAQGNAKVDIDHPRSVLNLMREHYSRYTPEMVERITGIPTAQFLEVAKLVGEMGRPDKVMTFVYAVGMTHHTTGVQGIRSGALLQLLLGNIGRPGGGVNALRGHSNIQGNSDQALVWEILPGYLKIPAPGQRSIADYVETSAAKRSHPQALNFFGDNYGSFMVSLLKTWYGDAATKKNEFAFDYIPKPGGDSGWMTMFENSLAGKMEGMILSGYSAPSVGPDTNKVIKALSGFKWLCVMDPLPTTGAEFWRSPGVNPQDVQTEVFQLPATDWVAKEGSFVNSGRVVQWKDQVHPPEDGKAMHDHWIAAELLLRVRELYEKEGGRFPDPIRDLTMDYADPRKPTMDEIAREINGRDLRTGTRLETFADLSDDGTTSAGNWIYTGHYPEAGNLAKRRDGISDPEKNDPTGMGLYPQWGWSWPLNRRILYNRASADPQGRPWDPKRPGIVWDESQQLWVGDVPDYPKDEPPGPNATLPFIMTGEGTGRLFTSSVNDGPFPEHYEPMESPVVNPLHPEVQSNPAVHLYEGVADTFGTSDEFPYIGTTYRLTEHEHFVTQHVQKLVALQPEAFVEVPAELAAEKGIENGDHVRVWSKRGKVEVRAVVTKRLGALQIDGKKIYHIGIPIHWGYVGINTSKHWVANALTPFVGDANTRTPEFKAFLVNIEKM